MDIFIYYPWLFPTLATIFGLIIGSFLNVVIHRLPMIMEQEWRTECTVSFPELEQATPSQSTLTLSRPASHCPHCHTPIKVRDNIPLFSWLFLRGHCRHCQGSISLRYPLVELLSALLACAISLRFDASYYSLGLMLFSFVLIAAAIIDLDTMLLPDQLTQPLLWSGIALTLMHIAPLSLAESVMGGMAGYLTLWLVYWGFKLLTGKEGMGYGDFKLLAAIGAWLGWHALPLVIFIASVVGIVFALWQQAQPTPTKSGSSAFNQAFPFGPALAIAGWISMMWGSSIIEWYWSIML